MTQQQ